MGVSVRGRFFNLLNRQSECKYKVISAVPQAFFPYNHNLDDFIQLVQTIPFSHFAVGEWVGC